ncbi:MAG: glycosyltransferase family 2 protein [Flavobacterium sp.]|uniref:glycosyltransferase family A protein n=1 Tax=Flavobacterium sp. TaxID=239 RepID=UPI0012294525|nr:glycosyltransferase family A protein [Flavobacterium sp.]RZJ66079.1 MAG: glycosyltransferase family 2 protein [Flavobacterium sp.]
MRIGLNPNRDKQQEKSPFFHQVVLPVYVPDQDGYFENGFDILRYCIDSLLLTAHKATYICVVDNGSGQKTSTYLDGLLAQGKIHELVHTTNIGKMNAVFKGISGHSFDWVTIADSDVMFLDGWQEATYDVFRNFPKAGAVCPTPSSKSYKTYGQVVLARHIFSSKMRFTPVKNRDGLLAFAHSVDNPDFYNEYQLENFLTFSNGNFRAVVGAGHFFTTYKARLLDKPVARYTKNMLGGESELIDKIVIDRGLWRLSTEDNYAYHLGNVPEAWMAQKITQLKPNIEIPEPLDASIPPKAPFYWKSLEWIAIRLFSKKFFLRWFLRRKGLSNEASFNY